MKTLPLVIACLLAVAGVAAGQAALNEGQGHPLKGIWIGDWGPDKAKRTPVLIEMNWDGKAITGSISPEADKIAFTSAELNHSQLVCAPRGAVRRNQVRDRRQDREPRVAEPIDRRHVDAGQSEGRLQDHETVGPLKADTTCR